jgi:hypothetical protein
MFKKGQFSIPKSLLSLAKVSDETKDKEQEALKSEWAYKQRQEALQKEECYKAALPIATKVYNWAEEFRCDRQGRELIIQGKKYNHLDGILLFSDKLPHQPQRYIGVSLGGVWYMKFGCGASPIFVSGASELAHAVPATILEAVWESLQSGAVWEFIKSRLEQHLA